MKVLDRVTKQTPIHRAQNLSLILEELKRLYYEVDNPEHKRVHIKRYYLRLAIMRATDLLDHVTIRAWFNHLLAKGYIIQNPDSHISIRKGLILPSNDTRYFINIEGIETSLKTRALPCVNSQTLLQTSTPNDCTLKEHRGEKFSAECSSSESQNETKNNLSPSNSL